MATPSKYRFVFTEDDEPFDEELDPQLSPKDVVANILRETELPDLDLRTESKPYKGHRKKKDVTELNTDQQLFSIDDDDDDGNHYTFNVELNIETDVKKDDASAEVKSGQDRNSFTARKPASVPPVPNVHHPRFGNQKNSFNTYIDTTTNDNNNEDDKPRSAIFKGKGNTTALLPMDTIDMEFDEDDVDSGVADTDHDPHKDTQPIVTVDQGQLNQKWRSRRQKINFLVALVLLIVGVVVITVAIILIIKMVRSS